MPGGMRDVSMPWCSSVFTMPGQSACTRTPLPASSFRRISRQARLGDGTREGEARGDVDDRALLARDHPGERRAGEAHRGDQVERDLLLGAVRRQLDERHVRREPGVVHEHGQRVVLRDELLHLAQRPGVGQVRGHHLRLDPPRACLSGERIEPVAPPRHEHDVVPVRRQPLRERLSDARRSPRHQRALPCHGRRG
jgi:hypothetical protein